MFCPSTRFVSMTMALALVVAAGGLSGPVYGQAPEILVPVPPRVVTEDNVQSSNDATFESCSCDHCAGHARFRRWRDNFLPYMQDYFWGQPWNFAAEPHGESVFGNFNTQVVNATIAKLALYRYDFYDGLGQDPRQLSPYGQRRLRKLAHLVLQAPAPLRIEETGDDALDEARRLVVISELEMLLSTQIDSAKVVVSGLPYSRMQGEEARIRYEQMLQQMQRGSILSGGGRSSFGQPTFGAGLFGGGAGGSGSSGNN